MSEQDSQNVIELRSLEVRYGRAKAVDRVSLSVLSGEVYALLGRNGSGKSSLVRCLLGHRQADGGAARLFGSDSFRHRTRLMSRVGVVPEEPDAPPAMSARELARFCARLYPRWDQAGFEARLGRFGISLTRPVGRLSKGQRGQVMLALALAPSPELLVLDDPTLGLDVVARRAVFEDVVGELADRGLTIFITSHELAAVEGVATRVGLLDRGRLVLDEDLEGLKTRVRRIVWSPATAEGARERLEGLLAAMAPRVFAERAWGFEGMVERFDPATFEKLQQDPGTRRAEAHGLGLEEIFVELAGDPAGGEP